MSLLINNNAIVDREREAKQIGQLLQDSTQNVSHVLILCADSGYGKSSIIYKVKEIYDNLNSQIIIVDTPPANSNMAPVEGQYLNYIAETLDNKLKPEYSLESFLYSSDNNYQHLINADSLLQAGHSIPSAIFAALGKTILTDLQAERLLYDTSVDSILVLKNYIVSTIMRTGAIIDITNAQNIDATSFRVIRSILQDPYSKKLILEYTTENGNVTEAAKFADRLGCTYTLMKIDKLPFEFALSIIGIPANAQKICEIESFYRDVVKGNLYKIVQAKMDSETDIINYSQDPIEKKVDSLGFASKLLLAILCLHEGEMDTRVFCEILNLIQMSFFVPANWDADLNTLIDHYDGKIRLRHASITESFPLTIENTAALSAYHYLVEYYEDICHSSTITLYQKQAVVQLVKLHSRFDPKRMIPLLEKFKRIIIEMLSEADAFALIKQAFEVLDNTRETVYHIRLVALCYEAGFYRGALELLSRIKSLSSVSGRVYMCMLLNRNDQHLKALELCEKLLHSTDNPRYKLIIMMVKMLSERSLNRVRDYKNTFKRIEKSQNYQNVLEYGFFLRNAQIVLPYKASIQYVQKSIDFFEQKGEKQYSAYSQLTYSIQLARLGRLTRAENILNSIVPMLLNASFEKHIVYVNQAAIRLLKRNANEQTLMLLDKALLTVTTVFDRIVILNNMLCALIINKGSLSEFEQLKALLKTEIFNEPDQRLRQKTYLNFYLYCRDISGNIEEAHQWKKAAINVGVRKGNQTIEDVFLFDEKPEEDLRFLATRNFCVSFITYWHFDIPILDF